MSGIGGQTLIIGLGWAWPLVPAQIVDPCTRGQREVNLAIYLRTIDFSRMHKKNALEGNFGRPQKPI